MKKYIAIVILVLLSTVVFAAHSLHGFIKISETDGLHGRIICQWECNVMGETHYATTTGYGYCMMP